MLLGRFERKILRKIIDPVIEDNFIRLRYNDEFYDIYKDTPIVNVLKMNRLRWAGHVWRMPNNMLAKISLDSQP
jgi:hypothetical protein